VYQDDQLGDQIEAEMLYDILEKDIVPLFYDYGANGLPHRWVAKMKRSMAEVGPRFNTQRMVQEYNDATYRPCIERLNRLEDQGATGARQLADWLTRVRRAWSQVSFADVNSDARDGITVGEQVTFSAHVRLGELGPSDVTVQVCLGTTGPTDEITDYRIIDMEYGHAEEDGTHHYEVTTRFEASGLNGYTMRILPRHPELYRPVIPGLVRWAA